MSALDHCAIKLYVHFLDLFREEAPPFPDTWEAKQDWHERQEEFERRLWDIESPGTEMQEVCMAHQCWLAVTVDLDDIETDLETTAADIRRKIKSLLCQVWG